MVEVYERLANEGYVTTRHGSGTYVANKVAARLLGAGRRREGRPIIASTSFGAVRT